MDYRSSCVLYPSMQIGLPRLIVAYSSVAPAFASFVERCKIIANVDDNSSGSRLRCVRFVVFVMGG